MRSIGRVRAEEDYFLNLDLPFFEKIMDAAYDRSDLERHLRSGLLDPFLAVFGISHDFKYTIRELQNLRDFLESGKL